MTMNGARGYMTEGRWYLPTRRRIVKLRAFFDSAAMSTPGTVLVQKDEFHELRAQYATIDLPSNWRFHLTESEGMGDKFREMWPVIKEGEWMGWLVDDLTAETPNWDTKLIGQLNGKNFVSAYDGGQNPSRMCVPVFSHGLLNAVGYLYPPGFFHTYLDDVWEFLGRQTKCWLYDPSVKLNHHHGFREGQLTAGDDTERISYSRMAQDKEAFDRWKKYVALQSIQKIKALYVQTPA